MLQNAEIVPVREDFGTRLADLALYIESPSNYEEPLFHDDEVAIVNTLLTGGPGEGLKELRELTEARVNAPAWDGDVDRALAIVADIAGPDATVLDFNRNDR